MGAILGTAGCVACCCGSAACSLCCSACPSCKNSTSTRIVYSLFLLFTTIVSCIMLSDKVEDQLKKIDWFCKKTGVGTCSSIVGYESVYRVEFGAVMFFLLFAILLIGVKSSRDPRSSIQNGFWAIKFLILIGIIVGAFFIKNEDDKFTKGWMITGLIGAFLFILVQLTLLIDFAHAWNENWVDNMEESGSKCWMAGLLMSTCIMYACTIAGIVCMFIYFTQSSTDSCHLEKFIVSFQLIMCIVISVMAILPSVQEHQPKSGLLQAAAISLYTSYLTWSALSYRPGTCNEFNSAIANGNLSLDAQSIIGIVVTFVLVMFACVRTSSSSQIGKLGLGDSENTNLGGDPSGAAADPERKGQVVYDDETESLTYSYTFFHFTMILATFYLMMTITNWYTPDDTKLSKLTSSSAAFWVKISSSWCCMLLYMWTLLVPVLFPDREFSG